MALLLLSCNKYSNLNKKLIIYNKNLDKIYSQYDIKLSDTFSIEFTHSVNMSPVIDYYKFDKNNNIYVYKTIYYNYGAGVETNLEGDETLRYGDDGSMIIENINKKINPLTYYLSNIYDHKLRINNGNEISLWEVCGKNIIINIVVK